MELRIETRIVESIPVIYAHGQIDTNNCYEVHEAIVRELDSGRVNIILNFKELSFIDSACLGMLLRSLDKAKNSGGGLAIVGNAFIDRVLTVTGLTHLFELYSDEDKALAAIRAVAPNN